MLLAELVRRLDMKLLPYVIVLIVPVLGRMSDPDDAVRAVATHTFASLVKMIPLEVSICGQPSRASLTPAARRPVKIAAL